MERDWGSQRIVVPPFEESLSEVHKDTEVVQIAGLLTYLAQTFDR